MRSSPVSLTSGADVSRRTALIGLAAAPLLIGAAPIPPDPTVDCNAGRFAGTDPEPRPGLRSGHIPGSRNLPVNRLIDPATGTLLSADALRRQYVEAGIDLARPVVTTCGSGVTASALAFGLHLLGHRDVAVYDGSWSEWGGRPDTPIET